MENKINEVVNDLINYKNKDKLSWLSVLKIILKERNLEYNDTNLNMIIKELTNKGYDIIITPFELKKYK